MLSSAIANSANMHNDHKVYYSNKESNDMTMDMISMRFHFGCNEIILFDWWHITTLWGLLGSVTIIFLLGILYEGLKYYREYMFWKMYNYLEYHPVTLSQANADAARSETVTPQKVSRIEPKMLSIAHFSQTFLHIVQVIMSFFLMLIFMIYNVWLCMAVILGAGFGYFMFCWRRSLIVDVAEHCH